MSDLIQLLARETGLGRYDIARIIASAPRRYKFYEIPKKNGAKRSIAQPAREVKALQRAFIAAYLDHLQVHSAATAYKKGSGIKANAEAHAGFGSILKMDFKNFFPSIKKRDWIKFCEKNDYLSPEDRRLSALLMFHRPKDSGELCLAIGAPSSPMLSNILMYEFDLAVEAAVTPHKIRYTRYADDMTFSAPRAWNLREARQAVVDTVRRTHSPNLDINEGKTIFATPKYRRSITGLILANDGRVTIGKEKKRLIHASVHRYSQGLLSSSEQLELAGNLAYINGVEPAFLEVLRRRYTNEVVARLMHVFTEGD